MADAPVTHYKHYMNWPICGYCMNAWDLVYLRQRPGNTSAQRWIEYCRVGGCDPDIWDHIDEGHGWPIGFEIVNGKPDWEEVMNFYEPPASDNRVFHMRDSDSDRAPWRKMVDRISAEWAAAKNAKYEKVIDKHGNVKSRVVPDEHLQWDEPESVAEDSDPDDEDIW